MLRTKGLQCVESGSYGLTDPKVQMHNGPHSDITPEADKGAPPNRPSLGTYLADELPDHPIPGGVMELVTVPAIRDLINLIFEAQSLGQCIQDIYGEPFVALGLPKDVLSHHHKRLFLRTTE